MKRGKKDKIHNQFILQNNNIDIGKFLGLQGGCCSNESTDNYNKQNQNIPKVHINAEVTGRRKCINSGNRS